MATAEERLMEWLRDAHAMEEQSETMLKHFADRVENYPDIKAKLEEHLAQGHRQAERLRACIERRGGDISTTKELLAKFVGMSQGLSGIFVGDEIIKGVMAVHTFEQMGVASYTVLLAAAGVAGDPETRSACEQGLRETQAMADWYKDRLADLTRRYLGREEVEGSSAKH